jgi:predicted RecB family endonuclease
MNIRNTLVNEYTVGGSLLLVGFGFFSTRFADVLSYQVTTVPSMIPVVGGASVTVGRILGIVPATLGLAVLFRKAKDVPVVSEATQLPIVKTVVEYVEDLSDEMGGSIEATPAIVMDLSAEELAAEQAMFCSEHDDYFSACGCGTKNAEVVEEVEEKVEEVKKTTGSPKQQAWRSCVAKAKGNMTEAKRLYTEMGY